MPNNMADTGLRNTKYFAKFCLIVFSGGVYLADMSHLFVGESGVSMIFILWLAISALFMHIGNVLKLSAKPKMGWVAAEPIVSIGAIVANIFVRRYWAMRKNIGKAVGWYRLCASPKITIAILVGSCCPFPTFIGRANAHLRPKEIGTRYVTLGSRAATKWGEIRGMIVHSNGLLTAVAHATGRLLRRGGNFIGVLQEYFSTDGRILEAQAAGYTVWADPMTNITHL